MDFSPHLSRNQVTPINHLILAGPSPHPKIKRQNHSLQVFSFFHSGMTGHCFLSSLYEALIRHDHYEAVRKTTSCVESVPLPNHNGIMAAQVSNILGN